MRSRKVKIFFSVLIAFALCFGVYSSVGRLYADNLQIDFSDKITRNNTFETISTGDIPAAGSLTEYVIPSGMTVGVKISIDGVMVLGFSDIRNTSGEKVCPAKDCGLKTGDIVTSVNGNKVTDAEDLMKVTENCDGKILKVTFLRNNQEKETKLTPVYSTEDKAYKIGMWVRDATSGIGTVTYINPENGEFGALGHPVTDADTGEIIEVGKGEVYSSSVIGINKGSKGYPGELLGMIDKSESIGEITANNGHGIFGKLDGDYSGQSAVPIALKSEVQEGPATILANIDGTKVEEYKAEIQRVYENSFDEKGMIIRITDDRLLQKTGGIVQGMSGSPILQNGKLIGAVTHVFINDPTRGYGIFIENMLAEK